MRRLAYALTVLLLVGLIVGLAVSPESRSGGNMLLSAAAAMGASDTLHVYGESNLGDQYNPGGAHAGSYERWYSPEGFRFDFYDAGGSLTRSIGGCVSTGEAWQFYPGWTGLYMAHVAQSGDSASCGIWLGGEVPENRPAGTVFTYDVGSERLAAFIAQSRDRFSQGSLRLDEITDENPSFTIGKGCPSCKETGYKGRRAVFEYLPVNHVLRGLINEGADRDQILEAAQRQGMRTLWKDTLDKVVRGKTSLDEMMRVVA